MRVLYYSLLGIGLLLASGCGNSYLEVGKRYLALGNPALAMEYFDAGVSKKKDAPTRRALLHSYQVYSRDLERQIEFLKAQKQAYRALTQLSLLEEITRRGEALQVPGASMKALNKSTGELRTLAEEQLNEELGNRRARGTYLRSDLALCRQLLALGSGRNSAVARNCQSLREHFKSYAALGWAPGSSDPGGNWLASLQAEVRRLNPELLDLVPETDERTNGSLKIFVGRPASADSGWHLMARQVYRKAIPLRDKRGRPVKETVELPPTQKQIDAAKRAKKPPPGNRRVVKQVYFHVSGEWKKYRREVRVQVPYVVRLRRQSEGENFTVPTAFGDVLANRATTFYEQYSGHPLANPRPKHTHANARAAAEQKLPSTQHLATRVLTDLPRIIAARTLAQVE